MDKEMEVKFYELVQQEAKRMGIPEEKLKEQFERIKEAVLKVGEALKKAFTEIYEALKLALEKICEMFTEWGYLPDRWQIEKMKMSNNERRQKGIPMVKRGAHLLHQRNQRKRK